MKRRGFLQLLGFGPAVLAVPIAAKAALASAKSVYPVGTILPFAENYAVPDYGGSHWHTHNLAQPELPSHTHSVMPHPASHYPAMAAQRVVYKKWNGKAWEPI